MEKHVQRNVPQTNRFEVIAELMEEETNLLGSTKGKEAVLAGDSALLNADVTPMDSIISPGPSAPPPAQTHAISGQPIESMSIPPPPESILFIKPKSKSSKKKNKILDPMHKEPKVSAQKPYNLPPTPKKQGSPPQMLPSIQTVSSAPLVPAPSIPHVMSPPQALPSTSSTAPPPPTIPITVFASMPLQTGHLVSPAVIPGTASLSSPSS
ncbi:hypothetical protein SLA2020_332610 [Shorea laevis]